MNLLILDKLGVDVKDAVYIGDTEIDLATARNTGMDLILVGWGFRPKKELEALGAACFADTADDVFSLIKRGAAG
jgi:phosphoglycolate phosphatase